MPDPYDYQDPNAPPAGGLPVAPPPAPIHQGSGGILGVLSHVLKPVWRATRIAHTLDQYKYEKQEREFRRQKMQLDLEQARRDRTAQDLQTALMLHKMHAMRALPGAAGNFQAALGGRDKPIDTPVGRYALPTPEQEAGFEAKATAEKARATEVGRKQAEREVDPLVDVTGVGGSKLKVPQSKAWEAQTRTADIEQRILAAQQRVKPGWNLTKSYDDKGDLHTVLTDPRTGEQKVLPVVKGVGKTKTQKAAKAGISSGAQRAMQNVQKLIDRANATNDEDKIKDPEAAKKRWKAASAAAQQAGRAFPEELEIGPGDLNLNEKGELKAYPWIQPKKGATTTEGQDKESDTSGTGVSVDSGRDDTEEPDTEDIAGSPEAAGTYSGQSITRDRLEMFARSKGVHPGVIEREFTAQGGQVV